MIRVPQALRIVSLVLVLAAPALPAVAQTAGFPRAELVVETRTDELRLTVEVARTPAQRAQGLMFRTRLDPQSGMLFLFGSEGEVGMWMKNTLISLDMLFIGDDERVKRIVRRTTPLSEKTIRSGDPALAVLELAAGSAARLGIRVGDRVRFRDLAPPPASPSSSKARVPRNITRSWISRPCMG